MTKRSPYIVVAMLCCLLAVATSPAYAASAWILWTQEATAPVSQLAEVYIQYHFISAAWEPTEGFNDKGSCEQERDLRWISAQEKWRKSIREAQARMGQSYTIEAFGTTSTLVREAPKPTTEFYLSVYRCLPDTIDPRGPKGGK